MRKLLLTPLLLLGMLTACEQSPPTAIQAETEPRFQSDVPGGELLGAVMTRNLSIGTDITKILEAEEEQIPIAVWTAHMEVVQSLPAERMAHIADEIATTGADIIGLQEVVSLYTQTPGDFLEGNPRQADELQYDFLQLLLDALRARGLHYVVASAIVTMDIELPAFDPFTPSLYDARIVNRDAIIVRQGVRYRNARQGIYQAHVPIEVAGVPIPFMRGWTSVDVRGHGREVRFVNTHLEAFSPLINWLQATELLGIFARSRLPVVMVGDFNSPPDTPADDPAGATYRSVLAAGFIDVWAAANPDQEGHTCCHADDLRNPTSTLSRRIDYIFFRGQLSVPAGFRGVGNVLLVGDDPADRTPSGLWPSDHAGVVAQVWVP